MKKTTFELLLPIVASISKTFYPKAIVSNTDGSFTITTCDTLWITIGYSVTVNLLVYTILSVDPNVSITVFGPSLPMLIPFDIYPPIFTHGTMLAKSKELKDRSSGFDKYPMIYMHDRTIENHDEDQLSAIERTSDCDFYFMIDVNPESWETLDHDRNAIKPMRNLLYAFKKALVYDNPGLIGIIDESTIIDNANWGEYIQSVGNVKMSLPDKLSGSYLKIKIPFLFSTDCDCDLIQETPVPSVYNPITPYPPSSANFYQFDFTAAVSFVILATSHKLGREPVITTYNAAGQIMFVNSSINSTYDVTINFNKPTTGRIVLT
jgi:hypothetical protein